MNSGIYPGDGLFGKMSVPSVIAIAVRSFTMTVMSKSMSTDGIAVLIE